LFDIWHSVFAGETDRVRRVLGGFIAMPDISTAMLEYPGVAEKADALAIGIYFGGYLGTLTAAQAATVSGWTMDQFFDEMENGGLTNEDAANGAMAELFGYMDAFVPIAAEYALDLVAYEGGQHLWAKYSLEGNTALETVLRQANNDPRMGNFYTELFNYWKQIGGRELFHFNHVHSPRFGNFGSLEYLDSDTASAPKYQAIHSFIDQNACWWTGCE
jgi:hypothetical protein